jgi:hypothetical protein
MEINDYLSNDTVSEGVSYPIFILKDVIPIFIFSVVQLTSYTLLMY